LPKGQLVLSAAASSAGLRMSYSGPHLQKHFMLFIIIKIVFRIAFIAPTSTSSSD